MIGVYAVVNMHNHKAYVGSSKNVGRRLAAHRWAIKHGRFLNQQPYQEDAIKFGFDAFEFRVLSEAPTIQSARELEEVCLELWAGDGLYNKCLHADGATGVKRNRAAYVTGAAKRLSDPEFTKKLSSSCKGTREIVVCPRCGLSGGGGNMRRYHFDNCKVDENQ